MNERELFIDALPRSTPQERGAFLDDVCGEDAELRSRLEELLRAHEEPDSLLERPVLGEGSTESINGDTQERDSRESIDEGVVREILEPSEAPDGLGRLGHFEVLEVVGQGGMGVVLKAADGRLNRIVAIKVLDPRFAANSTARRRFLREAQAAAAITHPHVITIHAVDENDKTPVPCDGVRRRPLPQRKDRRQRARWN